MTEDLKKFNIDTYVSALGGKFVSPVAEAEYTSLCAHLFKNAGIPKNEGAPMASPADIPALVLFGLIHTTPELHQMTKEVFDESQNDDDFDAGHIGQKLAKKLKIRLATTDGCIDIAPFAQETLEKLAEANPYLQQTALRMKSIELANDEAYFFMLPEEDAITNIHEQLHPIEDLAETFRPKNVSSEEIASFQPFTDLAFAKEVQQNILSIAKAIKIPVTTDSFKTLRITENETPKLVLGIDVSDANSQILIKELDKAGIGKYTKTSKVKNSERYLLAVDIARLDDDFIAQTSLAVYREKLSKGESRSV